MDYGLAFLKPQLYAHDYFIKYYEDKEHLPKLLGCWVCDNWEFQGSNSICKIR